MIKINLYAGPGSGKSTVSAILYGLMKTNHYSCELVREYAKDLVYQGYDLRQADNTLQQSIFDEQLNRENIIKMGKVKVLITDSPLFLNAFYSKIDKLKDESINNTSSSDMHFWIHRFDESFEDNGRSHNESESKAIDNILKNYIKDECKLNLIELYGSSEDKAKVIFSLIKKTLEVQNEPK